MSRYSDNATLPDFLCDCVRQCSQEVFSAVFCASQHGLDFFFNLLILLQTRGIFTTQSVIISGFFRNLNLLSSICLRSCC
eukprot:scaffold7520_cov140-Skeletonema_marinoi.AAC.5